MTKYINEEKVPINQLYIEFEGAYPNKVLVNYTSFSLKRFEENPRDVTNASDLDTRIPNANLTELRVENVVKITLPKTAILSLKIYMIKKVK